LPINARCASAAPNSRVGRLAEFRQHPGEILQEDTGTANVLEWCVQDRALAEHREREFGIALRSAQARELGEAVCDDMAVPSRACLGQDLVVELVNSIEITLGLRDFG
jgi:hypothetical protein